MANKYKILSEFTTVDNPDTISVNPFWAIAFVRFAQPLTFSRKKMFAGESSVSFDSNPEDLIKERTTLVISDDILQMNISQTKGNYVGSLSAVLMSGTTNYLTQIQPDDWVFAWIVNSEEKGSKLIQRIFKEHENCNNFDDGLKFVGRVQSIRKHLQQSPDGHRSVRYQLQAAGFKELASSVYYDPALAKAEDSIGQFLTEMNISLNDFFGEATQTSGGISTTKAIPRLFKLLMGEGIPPENATLGPVNIAAGPVITKEAPFAYAVPKTVLKLLGRSQRAKKVSCYADIVDLVVGLQKYKGGKTPEELFAPEGAAKSDTNHRILNDKLLGSFLPIPISFDGKPLWSLLEEFKNPALNEMYACLRINVDGMVVPTITVRQFPFSTEYAMQTKESENLTGVLEVPRWVCDSILVNSLDIGKSDSTHLNFIHVYPLSSAQGGVPLTLNIATSPPTRDEEDIKRSGLRPHMQTIACSIGDTLDSVKKWLQVTSDFLIGQQYTLNGSITTIGISAPICPGDNFEFDDVVYHIEGVTHSCSINQGYKQFNTTVTLVHGMRSEVDTSDAEVSDAEAPKTWINPEFYMYSGTQPQDNLGHNPGITSESQSPTTARVLDEETLHAGDINDLNTNGTNEGKLS
jgi:hypothetical protein